MSLGNVLHKPSPLLEIGGLNRLTQSPEEMASLMRFGTRADIGIRLMDKVAFDLADDTPFISIGKQERYLNYIVIFYVRP